MPTWLKEKKPEVSVNWIIWVCTSVSAVIFIVFGWSAALSFPNVDTEILKNLASPQTAWLTRFAAAIFGVSIIGCGVPVFCVMIKNAIYSSRMANAGWSFFWGAVFPYAVSWTLFQGSALMTIMNWAGLIVNGTCAFILPLVLALCSYNAEKRKQKRDLELQQAQTQHVGDSLHKMGFQQLPLVAPTGHGHGHGHGHGDQPLDEDYAEQGSVYPIPDFMHKQRKHIIVGLLAFFVSIIGGTIAYDIVTGTSPDTG